ncbi:hypothetical protein Ocin01_09686 [Orchesella cincta]|uniref:HAT C-terminal dimerisation domain-containing protein n=1 Tax=Orchesella cincta TaxID=48709 RepID=A0A1D2MW18_ORCCI|nr:hypothetical protein Ocin01_09686 [Orchesella cincta]
MTPLNETALAAYIWIHGTEVSTEDTDIILSKIDPKTFWNVVKTHCSSDSEACNIACRLQKLPASGSSIERCFSTLSSIMTKTRNRLGIEKAGKLCTIYQSLHFLPDEEYM